jgi:Cu(I)/Ag(I) efflux system membrane fusion protein
MKIRFKILILLLIAAGAFLAGYWMNHKGGGSQPTNESRILYYVDPMHPSYKSDKPGIVPDCGMPLEPVYADKSGAVTSGPDSRASMPPGTIRVSLEKQQLIGVKVMTIEKAPCSHTRSRGGT